MSKQAKLSQVVIGILKNTNNEVLLSTRHYKTDFSDCLEFPGGKKEPNESNVVALKRELKEELGINIKEILPIEKFIYQYDTLGVELYPFKIHSYSGDLVANEKEEIIWVNIEDLDKVKILPGSKPIVQSLIRDFNTDRF